MTRLAEQPLLLVVGAGDRRYREYILASAARWYRLWLLSSEPVSWHSTYLLGSTQVDPHDIPKMRAAARAVAGSRGRLAGVLCYDEWLVHDAALLARELGLPGPDPDAVAVCRDKARTRELLRAAGVPQPASAVVATAAEARAAAHEMGYPVVLKARALAGSVGVVRAESPEQIDDGFAVAAGGHLGYVRQPSPPVLVEQYLSGPEISIDAALIAGTMQVLVLARKSLGFAPYFEEVGHTVTATDPLISDRELLGQLERIHRVLNIDSTITHSEFRLSPGGPRLVEINARLGGDFIPRLGHLATGLDVARAAADVAAGVVPDCSTKLSRAAGIRFFYPDRDCRASFAEILEGQPAEIETLAATITPGQQLHRPPNGFLARYGYAVAVAQHVDDVNRALATAEQYLRLHAEPLVH